MNALLIYPELPVSFWSFRHALSLVGKRSGQPPLGLLTVASMLPDDWNVRLVDQNVEELLDDDIAWADVALVSAMVVQTEAAHAAIDACHAAGVRVIAGGPLFTMRHEQFPRVDHLILNEAEATLPAFFADLKRGDAKRIYQTAEYPPLDTSPVPMWSLLQMDRYSSMPVQFSRGCPFLCDFCNVTSLFGRKPRIKTADQIVRELDALYSQGWRGPVFFVDDNMIGDRRYVRRELLPALTDWRRDKGHLPFSTEVTINLADDPDLTAQFKAAGFDRVFVGIETPNVDALAQSNKGQNTRTDLTTAVRRLHQAGIEVRAGFIVGFDTDKEDIFQRQFDFIQGAGIVIAMMNMLQAPPGTALYERLMKEGRIINRATGGSHKGTNVLPMMGTETLLTGYNKLVSDLYAPAAYYRRIKRFLTDHGTDGQAPPQANRLGNTSIAQRLLVAVKIIVQLGVIDKGRLHFWGLFFWALRKRPELLPDAVTLSVLGWDLRTEHEIT